MTATNPHASATAQPKDGEDTTRRADATKDSERAVIDALCPQYDDTKERAWIAEANKDRVVTDRKG